MGDLFSTTEPTKPKKKIFYKGKGGKFSDKETARITAIEKDNKKLTLSNEYWKRQAERLAEDYKSEHTRRLELEEQVKLLTKSQNLECAQFPIQYQQQMLRQAQPPRKTLQQLQAQ